MDASVTIKMKKSLGGFPPRHAKKEYTVSALEAAELIGAGYAEEVGGGRKSAAEEKTELAEKAKTMGIEVDARWGVERLKQEIAAVEAGAEA